MIPYLRLNLDIIIKTRGVKTRENTSKHKTIIKNWHIKKISEDKWNPSNLTISHFNSITQYPFPKLLLTQPKSGYIPKAKFPNKSTSKTPKKLYAGINHLPSLIYFRIDTISLLESLEASQGLLVVCYSDYRI